MKLCTGVVALVCLLHISVLASQHGNSGNRGQSMHVAASTHPAPSANAGPKANASPKSNGGPKSGPKVTGGPKTSGPKTPKGPSANAGGPKSHGPNAPVSAGSSAKNTGHGSPKKNATTTTSTSTAATTTPGAASTLTTINFAAGPVGEKLTKNTTLQAKLATKLEALGYDGNVFQGVYGFKNLGQANAAMNIAQHLGIPFEQLKLSMTGLWVDADGHVLSANLGADGKLTAVDPANVTTPATIKSLGQSIQTLKPGVNATSAAQSATAEAEAEIANTSSTSTTTTTLKK